MSFNTTNRYCGLVFTVALICGMSCLTSNEADAKTIFGVYGNNLEGESLSRLREIRMPFAGIMNNNHWSYSPSYRIPWRPEDSDIPELLDLEKHYHNHMQRFERMDRPFRPQEGWVRGVPSDIYNFPSNGKGINGGNAVTNDNGRQEFIAQIVKGDLAGKEITISFWAKREGVASSKLGVYIREFDPVGNLITGGAFGYLWNLALVNNYTNYSATRMLDAKTARILISLYDLEGGGIICVDNVLLTEAGKTANLVKNGDFETGYSYWRDARDMPQPTSMKVSFKEFCRLWLDNHKKIIAELYRNGVYIIDVGFEAIWLDLSGIYGSEWERYGWKYFAFSKEESMALGEDQVKQIIKDTYKELYLWKNNNFPNVVLCFSLSNVHNYRDDALNIHKDLPWFDWIGPSIGAPYYMISGDYSDTNNTPGITNRLGWSVPWKPNQMAGYDIQRGDIRNDEPGYNLRELFYDKMAFIVDHKYIYPEEIVADGTMKPYEWYHDAPRLAGGQEYSRSWGIANFEAYQMTDPDDTVPYSYKNYMMDDVLQTWKYLESTYGAGKDYLKFSIYADWIGRGPDNPYYGDRYCFLSQDLTARSKFYYVRDNILNPANKSWGSALWPLVVRKEDIQYDPNYNSVSVTLRNLCADMPISSRVQVFARKPNEGPPWRDIANYPADPAAFIKARPEDIRSSLIQGSLIRTIERGEYSVPGNSDPSSSCLNGDKNIVTLSVPLARKLQDGDVIYVYVEDNELVKGWTAYNDIPIITRLTFTDGSLMHTVPIRVRAQDNTGCFSNWTEGVAGVNTAGHVIVEARDPDGIACIELEYCHDGFWKPYGIDDAYPFVIDWDPTEFNIVNNSDFEEGPAGWSISAIDNARWVGDAGRDGSAGVVSNGGYNVAAQMVGQYVGRSSWRVSVYAKGEGGATLGFYIRGRSADGQILNSHHYPVWGQPLTADYQRYEGTFTLSSSAVDRFEFRIYNSSPRLGTIYIDEAECVKIDDCNELINGTFEQGKAGWNISSVDYATWVKDAGRDGSAGVVASGGYNVAWQRVGERVGRSSYRVSVYAKGEGGATLGIYIRGMSADGKVLDGRSPIWNQSLTANYQKYEGTFTMGSSAVDYLEFRIYNSSPRLGTIYIDEAECAKTEL